MKHSVCGIQCDECRFFGEQCGGCAQVLGKPFWTAHLPTGVCPLYSCCSEKNLVHCGHCGDFPCKKYEELRDPGMTEEQHQQGLQQRIARVRKLSK